MSKPKKTNNPDIEEEIQYDSESEDYARNGFSVAEGESGAKALKKIKKLQEELSECKEEKQEYLDGWQRTKADFVNLKKRAEEDRKSFAKYANEEFIMELLPALDSFDQAFQNKEAWEKVDSNWRSGVEFIHSQLLSILNNHGVSAVDPLGEEFNPELHHSIEMIEVEEEKDDGKIVQVTQKGYRLGDKIIRHPGVKVGKKK
jgi:molecular chaperone GrpE